MIARLAIAAVLVSGCGSKDAPTEPAAAPATAPPATPPTAKPPESPRVPKDRAVEAVWKTYRDAHAGATPANAVDTGKKLWPLLAPDAQTIVETSAAQTVASVGKAINLPAADVRYKVLGESAAARAATMQRAEINELTIQPDRIAESSITSAARLRVRDGATTLTFELESTDGGPWRFAGSRDLLASDNEVFKTPAGQETTVGTASIDALAARWKQVNASGTGWDAYNLMSPAMRTKIINLVSRVGGNGAGDAARIFEKTLTDRRGRGVSITSIAIDDRTADSANLTINYSVGRADKITAVRVDGAWWIEMPL